jgi:hypothetical protein
MTASARQHRLFGYPSLERTGLGNMLLPWARCVLWCRTRSATTVAPAWAKLRLGPYLRDERDKRQYHLFHDGRYLTGSKRLLALLFRPLLSEKWATRPDEEIAGRIVVFRGMKGLFDSLIGHEQELGRELRAITRREYLPELHPVPFAAVHVRLGDFTNKGAAGAAALRGGEVNLRIPLDWYVHALQELRDAAGANVPALVFTDGSEAEVGRLLALPAVTPYRGASAVTELLAMAGATTLIASGSTFSMWAAFLGGMPCVWHPGQRRAIFRGLGGLLEPEWQIGQRFGPAFVDFVRRRINHPVSMARGDA